jgi:hypothetical protein
MRCYETFPFDSRKTLNQLISIKEAFNLQQIFAVAKSLRKFGIDNPG